MQNDKEKYKETRRKYEIKRNIKRARARWVKALRSGKYEQGHGMLRYGNTFCCLGVACKVARIPNNRITGGFLSSMFPTILKRLGLTHLQEQELARLNDNRKKTFREIADHIERMPIDPSFYEEQE